MSPRSDKSDNTVCAEQYGLTSALSSSTLVAVERDPARFQTLSAMLKKAGATNTRLVKGDFMKLKPEQYPRVTAILLDPSCSGTGEPRELRRCPACWKGGNDC